MFGILNLNKPPGPTSRDCINQIQRLVRPYKVGHAGTLDPLADGVLLVLVGQAVRITEPIHSLSKRYVGEFLLGVESESADTESEVRSIENPPVLCEQHLEAVLPSFVGEIQQTPPKYSAVWVDGKRAHELARKGKEFEVPARSVTVESIVLSSFQYPRFELTVTCGTGTYIRSIGRDIARMLGSDAVMTRLTRNAIGPFELHDAVQLSALQSKEGIESSLLPARLGVNHWPQAFPSEGVLKELEQGKQVRQERLGNELLMANDFAAAVDLEGRLRALIKRLPNGNWQADKCFLLSLCS
jgi:tRNA pseudouridine55 synthase